MKKTLSNHLFLWKLCFKTCPMYMLYVIFDAIRYEASVFVEHTLGIRYVLHCAEYGEPFWKAAAFEGGIILGIMLLMIPDGYYQHYMVFMAKPMLYKALKEQMFEKAAKIDLCCYDDPKYYNDFVLSVAESEKSIDRFIDLLTNLFKGLTVLFTTGIFFLIVDWKGIIFVVVSFVLRFVLSKGLNKMNYKLRLEVNPKERKRNYVSRLFYLKDYAKELRLHPEVGERLENEFHEANQEIYKANRKIAFKKTMLSYTRRYLCGDFLTDGLYVAYLVYCAAVLHTIDYSNAVVLFNRIASLRRSMAQLADVAPQAHENSMYIDKIRAFLAYEPKIEQDNGEDVEVGIGELVLDHVTFKYNENSPATLNDVSLTVKPGEHIAIVGYNGAGKTTLIKLLMRLYDPSEGNVYYKGKDIREYRPSEYRKRIGVVFQDYQLYGASLAENVVLDRLSDEETRENAPVIEGALERAGFGEKYKSLPNGLFTSVTNEFDKEGTDFSGGESQKIAISRAFYKDADILIMDEPSSALDPIAEYELNHAMEEAAVGKTVFYISHRLSTTRDADRIVMFEKGSIIEEGSHEELLARNGKYAQMWNTQARNYKN